MAVGTFKSNPREGEGDKEEGSGFVSSTHSFVSATNVRVCVCVCWFDRSKLVACLAFVVEECINPRKGG